MHKMETKKFIYTTIDKWHKLWNSAQIKYLYIILNVTF
jgi:hypothetical protein